ncbi:MAG: hypothetical protein JNJ73_15935 [Hyphomonadaceae bacterium]|nr:hypothetical protein [Hyphomonadaceae bacterium]
MRMLLAALFGLVLMGVSAPQAAARTFDLAQSPSLSAAPVQKCAIDVVGCTNVGALSIAFATNAKGADIGSDVDCGLFDGPAPTVTQLSIQFATGARGAPAVATTTLFASRRAAPTLASAGNEKRSFLRRLFT